MSYSTSAASAQFSGGPGVGGDQSCIFPSIVLPVEVLWMKAACENGTPTLAWATATEQNNAHFVIERSAHAETWDAVGQVDGAGSSQQVTEYAWRDPAPLPYPTVYYRLRQVDLDVREEVLAVLPLEACAGESSDLLVLPNPTDGAVEVRWSIKSKSTSAAVSELHVLDLNGRVLLRERVSAESMRATIDLSSLAAGSYTLVGSDADGALVGSARVVRQ